MIGPKVQRTCRYGFRYNGHTASPNNGNFLHHRIYVLLLCCSKYVVKLLPLGLPQFLTTAARDLYVLMSDCIEVKRLLKQNALVYKK